MARLSLLVAAAAVLLCFAMVSSAAVVDLTPDNFDSVVDGSKAVLVEFFAPWCGHCKALAPEWERLGEAFAKTSAELVIAKVDADAHSALGSKFGVEGFPTIKLFAKGAAGSPIDYEGERTAEALAAWVSEKTGVRGLLKVDQSAVLDLVPSNFDSLGLAKGKSAFVEFFAPWCGHCKALAPTWEKLANAFAAEPNVVIAKVDANTHRDLGERYGVSGFPTLKWFGAEDKQPVDYNGGRDLDSLVAYVNEHAGTRRQADGRLDASAGRSDALDAAAKQFVAAGATERTTLISTTKASSDPLAAAYARIMEKAASDAGYIAKEAARVERMLKGSDLSNAKVDEFTKRLNVLKVFQA